VFGTDQRSEIFHSRAKDKSTLSPEATDVVQMISSDLLNNQGDPPEKRRVAPDLSGPV